MFVLDLPKFYRKMVNVKDINKKPIFDRDQLDYIVE